MESNNILGGMVALSAIVVWLVAGLGYALEKYSGLHAGLIILCGVLLMLVANHLVEE